MLRGMRITKIKLAGFKSFVDPTTLYLPGNLTGVVGPNGCGKSNIIDAMIWVMGESSAKHLRGDSMADVIFSGSNSRKPVGVATVELIFDNSDGTLGGAYAGFNEISIKRSVTRDGLSNYFLNGTRCRRKDIIDVFLGTGLGARGGYSVIEQGMISRVIEAKPEELRSFLEEAAGISKYKERRRETETRIRHTQENLARVDDVRAELDKQLGHLQRQAKAAEKYQELKAEERKYEAELIGLRWRAVDQARGVHVQATRERENAVEASVADLRKVEAEQSVSRTQQTQALDEFNARQADFYAKSAEISRLEQALKHHEEQRQRLAQDLGRARFSQDETQQQYNDDLATQASLNAQLEQLLPIDTELAAIEASRAEELQKIEQAAEAWQETWDNYNRAQAETARLEHAEQVRLELLQAGVVEAQQRADHLSAEKAGLDLLAVEQIVAELSGTVQDKERGYDAALREQHGLREALEKLRRDLQRTTSELHAQRSALQQMVGQQASLSALQDAALGRDQLTLTTWLTHNGCAESAVLGRTLQIDAGWERALETALKLPIASLCGNGSVARLLQTQWSDLPVAALGAIDTDGAPVAAPARLAAPCLVDKVQTSEAVAALLAGVYAVDSLAQARALQPQLAAHESVVTLDGIWLGPNWAQVPGKQAAEGGVLARQRTLETATARLTELEQQLAATDAQFAAQQAALTEHEQRDRHLTLALHTDFSAIAELKNQIAMRSAERMRTVERANTIANELAQLAQQAHHGETTLVGLRDNHGRLCERLLALTTEGMQLNEQRRQVQAQLETVRTAWRAAQEAHHEFALKRESLRSTHGSLELALTRNSRLLQELSARRAELELALQAADDPQVDLQAQLNLALTARLSLEEKLKASREVLDGCEQALRAAGERHAALTREIAERQRALEQTRLEERALEVRAQELEARLQEHGAEISATVATLAPDASEEGWRERIEAIGTRISRLGPINLAAIDEFAQLSERKTYLDNQYADLTQALATLAEAMHKIDKETRTRFKETFDKVNTGMQTMFPVLFGGGHAYLEMVGDDLLEAGVAVMARPPGKRNSTIHLLSGGEKALTALAFVFSLFELNPAPFCLLDEVDAPLDDSNVVRLTEMLKTMATRVQFLFVTHNKITMEIAEQLIGVTMQEAGVSRLVTVNMEEAVALAESA